MKARVGVFGRKGQDEAPAQREESLRESAVHTRESEALEVALSETADPKAYVPREGTEHALRELERCVTQSGRAAGLHAAPGMGKTMLLRVLAQRLTAGRHQCVFLPYGALELPDLCAWVLGILGRPKPIRPADAMLAHAHKLNAEGSPLVLLVDDANGLSAEVVGELCALQAGSSGALQLVLALHDTLADEGLLEVLDSLLDTVSLEHPMTLAETSELLRTRLDRAGVPKVTQNRLDRVTMETLHPQSRGVPRLAMRFTHRLLAELPSDICSSWHWDEDWSDVVSGG
jgi:type II secretory pathway predicted ATPase ExeA